MNVKNKIPKSVKLKTYLVTVLLISVIFAGALNYALSNAYVGEELEPWLTLPLQEASYIIGQYNSTHYYARNSTGYGTAGNEGYEMLSTNALQIINWTVANTSITGGGIVHLKPMAVIIANSIVMRSNVKVEGEGNATVITLADNANCPIFVNANEGGVMSVNTEICHMRLHGNWENNNNLGRGTFYNGSGLSTPSYSDWVLYAHDLYLYQFQGDGICIDGGGGADSLYKIDNIHGGLVGGGSVQYGCIALIGVYDSFISNLCISGGGANLYLSGVAECIFSGSNYLGGCVNDGIYMDYCYRNSFGGSWILDAFGKNGIHLTNYYGSSFNQFCNFQVRANSGAGTGFPDNTYAAVQIEGGGGRNSSGNQFTNFMICNWTASNQFKYGVRLETTTNNNSFDCLTIDSNIIATTAYSDLGINNLNDAGSYQLFSWG